MFRTDERENFGDLICEGLELAKPALLAGIKRWYKVKILEEWCYRGFCFRHVENKEGHAFQTVLFTTWGESVLSSTKVARIQTEADRAKYPIVYADVNSYAEAWWSVFRER